MIKSKKIILILIATIALLISILTINQAIKINPKQPPKPPIAKNPNPSLMKLTSRAFKHQSYIPSKYTCDGLNLSPPLSISGLPQKTKSLALIVDDPDAPTGDWVHWLVWNINPKLTKTREGKNFQGSVTGLNDFGQNNYRGPCPPSGTHRYQFKLYALDTVLSLKPNTKKSDLLIAIQGHVIDQTTLIGFYKK